MELIFDTNFDEEKSIYSFTCNSVVIQLINFSYSGDGTIYKFKNPQKGTENDRFSQVGIGNYEIVDDRLLYEIAHVVLKNRADDSMYYIKKTTFDDIFIIHIVE